MRPMPPPRRTGRGWRPRPGSRAAGACAALARAVLARRHDPSKRPHFLDGRARADADRRVADAERAIARLREAAGDSVPLRAAAAWSAAELALRAGRLAEAEAEARDRARPGGAGIVTAAAAEVLALALVERGALAEAREVLDARGACATPVLGCCLAEGDYEAAAADGARGRPALPGPRPAQPGLGALAGDARAGARAPRPARRGGGRRRARRSSWRGRSARRRRWRGRCTPTRRRARRRAAGEPGRHRAHRLPRAGGARPGGAADRARGGARPARPAGRGA